jgi:putative aldouronate transport system permease protein
MWNSMLNTIFIAGVGCVLSLIGCCIAAYPIAYGDFYGKKLYTYIIIFTMWFQAGIVPLFLNIQGLGLYNSPWALILNGLITAYNVTIIRSYFQSIPFSIIESARIDGAGDYRILLQFIIPLSKPVLATVALWIIVGHWNDYLNPLILLSDQKKETLQLFLKRLVLSSETSTSNLASANAANNKGVAALSQQLKNGVLVVSMTPMIILYPFLQKFFVSGVTLGAVKG